MTTLPASGGASATHRLDCDVVHHCWDRSIPVRLEIGPHGDHIVADPVEVGDHRVAMTVGPRDWRQPQRWFAPGSVAA